jgi:hypothetical protein
MSQHTPGPWFVVNIGADDEPMMSVKAARIAGQEPRHEVAICATGDSPQEMEDANARLIAAAPELLEALEMLMDEATTDQNLAAIKALAAIAKARGEER